MAKAIDYKISGLRCDAPGCDYHDDDARFEDYEKYLNAPCPKCGASLLTEADLAATKAMVAAADWINQLAGNVPVKDGLDLAVVMDGSGVPTFRVRTKAASRGEGST